MFYNGSIGDRQMAYGPGDGGCRSPVSNWPPTGAQRCETGQPVRVAVVNNAQSNGISAPGERDSNYVHPFASAQDSSDTSTASHLSFLYDRAQSQPYSPEAALQQNGYGGGYGRPVPIPVRVEPAATAVAPPSEYAGMYRATPAPAHQSPMNGTSSERCLSPQSTPDAGGDYRPFSRATPAPVQQRSPRMASGDRSPGGPSTGDAAMPPSPSINGVRSPTEMPVRVQMSKMSLDTDPPSSRRQMPTAPPVGGLRTRGLGHVPGRQQQHTLPANFARRQSAPGPIGQSVEPGSRKPWSYTPSFGSSTTGGRTGPAPVGATRRQTPEAYNEFYRPQTMSKTAEGPRIMMNNGHGDSFRGSRDSVSSENANHCSVDGTAIDTSSIRYNLREGEEDVGEYEQASIRYTGKANPSKTFRLLQTATGSDPETDAKLAQATARRQARRRQSSREDLLADDPVTSGDADDIVDISYVGANIPSRTFRILQEAIGERGLPVDAVPVENTEEDGFSGSGRNVRVVHLRPMKKHSSLDNILSYSDL